VLGYSDVQADLAAALIRAGATVLITNQRTLEETKAAMRMVGGAIGRATATEGVIAEFERELHALRREPGSGPRIYFEEWPDPVVTGIAWVGELIELLGGTDIYADRRGRAAKERSATDDETRERRPEVVVGSWCGKPVDLPVLRKRFETTPAGIRGQIYEIPSDAILQPGARLIRGAQALQAIFEQSGRFARCV
jgi:iron complex transport system substrate-binding protein